MNEIYINFNESSSLNMCCVCVNADNLRPMSLEEINWYRSVVFTSLPQYMECKLNICVFCRQLLKKFKRFSSQCQSASVFLMQIVHQDTKTLLNPPQIFCHNLSISFQTGEHVLADDSVAYSEVELQADELHDIALDDEPMIDFDEVDNEDDVPLVMLSRNEECAVKKKKKKKRKCKERENVMPAGLSESSKHSKLRSKQKKPLKEGFTSRMVQETDEYTVIKLTKEQVVSEMSSRKSGARYRESAHRCELCALAFNFPDVLEAHMLKHSKERGPHECDICHQYCPSAVSLRGHIKSHTTRYSCKVCGCVRASRQHLLEHHARHHTAPRTYTCRKCHYATDARTVMQRHVRVHRQQGAGGAAGRGLQCPLCRNTYKSKEALRVHIARHDKSCHVYCATCGRGFPSAVLLARHAASHNKDAYCVECDRTFTSQDNLRLHFKKAKRHRDTAPYTEQCPLCPLNFPSLAALQAHTRGSHALTGCIQSAQCALDTQCEENSQCILNTQCTDNSQYRGGFVDSTEMQLRDEPQDQTKHTCDVCGKSFTRKSALTVHLRSHKE